MSEAPVYREPGGSAEAPVTKELAESLEALLVELRAIRACLARIEAWTASREPTEISESGSEGAEPTEQRESFRTWILTDQRVAAIEEAIGQEQRVRGTAYGG